MDSRHPQLSADTGDLPIGLRPDSTPSPRDSGQGSVGVAVRVTSTSLARATTVRRLRPSGVSELASGDPGGPVDRVFFRPLGLGEPDLGQHASRSGVPVRDRGPQRAYPDDLAQAGTANEASVA